MEAHHAAAAVPAANVWRGERGGERVSIDVTPARRFDADDTEALGAYFAEHGYVVVRRAADEAAVERGTALLWEFLEAHTARPDGLRRLGMRSALLNAVVHSWAMRYRRGKGTQNCSLM